MHEFVESSQWHSPAHQLRTLPSVHCSHFGARWWPQFTLPWFSALGSNDTNGAKWNKNEWTIIQMQLLISFYHSDFYIKIQTFKMFAFAHMATPVRVIFTRLALNGNGVTRFVLWVLTTVFSITESICMRFWTYAFF